MCIRDSAKFRVGVDGGERSFKAFCEAFAMLQRNDKLIVYHCSNPGRYAEMAPCFHPDVIMSKFETEAIKYGMDPSLINAGANPTIEMVIEEKQHPSDRIRDKIVQFVSAQQIDVLFLGTFGAKGQDKPGAVNKEGLERVGSSAQAAVERAWSSVVIIHSRVPARMPGSQARFLVAVDGSDLSHKGLMAACHLAQPADTVLAMVLSRDDSTGYVPMCFRPEAIAERYTELLSEEYKLGSTLLESTGRKSVGRYLVDAAEREDVHASYLVLGSRGMSSREAYLGSVAKFCMQHVRVNMVVVKEQSSELRPQEDLTLKGAVGEGEGV
eukprot:TRINITY_DN9422_c0_g1_i1.p1 TRINITY_DN9422_c0_g1~~TRINITY_DN9422_c0_g1_i1.p1  ORF type:complete len:325 (-),score=91.91 TRINITY_DN9422_c0_g1_i1:65-1039(-)